MNQVEEEIKARAPACIHISYSGGVLQIYFSTPNLWLFLRHWAGIVAGLPIRVIYARADGLPVLMWRVPSVLNSEVITEKQN